MRALTSSLWLLLSAGPLMGQELTAAQQAAFAVLDKLDPRDTAPMRFLRVTNMPKEPETEPRIEHGFLLAEQAGSIRLRRLDLDEITVASTLRTAVEAVDLRKYAAGMAADLRSLKEDPMHSPWFAVETGQMPLPSVGLCLARACAQRGMLAEVHLVWNALPDPDDAMKDLAAERRRRLWRDFADEHLARKDLVQRHRAWLAAFPDHDDAAAVTAMARDQQRLLDEEGAHARPAAAPGSAGDVAELVFLLRDQRTPVTVQPGDDYLLARAEPDPSPAGQLQARGMRAVGALIAAMKDETPSRCVQRAAEREGGYRLRSVGSLCEDLLQKISGLTFAGDDRQPRWQQWWQASKEQGEDALLAELVRRGDDASPGAAERLLKTWPARAADVIEGLRHSRSLAVRARLLGTLARLGGAEVVAFLQDELVNGTYLETQVMAASALLDRGRREGLELMLRAWTTDEQVVDTKTLEPAVGTLLLGRNAARIAMVGLLLTSGDAAAVEALGSPPAGARPLSGVVVKALLECGLADLTARAAKAQRAELEKAVARLVTGLLSDASSAGGRVSVAVGSGRNGDEPRVKDLAACAAVRLWPGRFTFDAAGEPAARDRQITAIGAALMSPR